MLTHCPFIHSKEFFVSSSMQCTLNNVKLIVPLSESQAFTESIAFEHMLL